MNDETRQLEDLESVIEKAETAFVTKGLALKSIRDSGGKPSERLYRAAGFETWDEYCQARWDFTPQRAGQIIASSECVERLRSEKDFSILPQREWHAATLCRLDSHDDQAAVWQKVLDWHERDAKNNRITATKIGEFVAELLPQKESAVEEAKEKTEKDIEKEGKRLLKRFYEWRRENGDVFRKLHDEDVDFHEWCQDLMSELWELQNADVPEDEEVAA